MSSNGCVALVLGGGVGGLAVANRLASRLARQHRIVLVEREAEQVFQPSLLWLAVGDRTPEAIRRPVERLAHRRIEIRRGAVEAIDPSARAVTVNGERLVGDAVVISLGAELDPGAIGGLAEAGHSLYSPAGAAAFRDALAEFRGGRVAILTAKPLYKCPPAPYEAALLVESALSKRGLREHSEITMYAAEPAPVGVTGPDVSAAVRALVEARGIAYRPGHELTAADASTRLLTFANGTTAAFDVLLYVAPHRAPAAVRDAGLTAASGWIRPDRLTFETAFPGVYAIGDVTEIVLANGKPLPKAGVFAHGAARVVADNIAATWAGGGAHRTFDGNGACFLEVGHGRAGFVVGNFYAEPAPGITLRRPAPWWHWAKVLFERRSLAARR